MWIWRSGQREPSAPKTNALVPLRARGGSAALMRSALHIDKLALVSRLILDERVLCQRRDIEDLRLQLFWKDHNIERLAILMRSVNTLCNCINCEFVGINRRSVPRSEECKFDGWFQEHVIGCGMTVGVPRSECGSAGLPASAFHMSHAYFLEDQKVYDVDAHFYQQEAICLFWKYGSKLWKATSVDDPELGKLHALFERLEAICG